MALDPTMKEGFDTKVAIGDYGTQLFHFNTETSEFEYALPLVSGGEYGGETETFEAPEMDRDIVAKIAGRVTLSDVTYTSNYTKDRYKRWTQILSSDIEKPSIFMEVFSDGSAAVTAGTSGRPTIQGGDVRQIEVTVAPSNMIWVDEITNIGEQDTVDALNALLGTSLLLNGELPINAKSVPTQRKWAYQGTEDAE